MKLYTREEFLKLPENTIYSEPCEFFIIKGLFCKTSDADYGIRANDFISQDLLSEIEHPDGIHDCMDAFQQNMDLLEDGKEIRVDFDMNGRDSRYDNSDKFIVWDNQDIKNLADYLTKCLK